MAPFKWNFLYYTYWKRRIEFKNYLIKNINNMLKVWFKNKFVLNQKRPLRSFQRSPVVVYQNPVGIHCFQYIGACYVGLKLDAYGSNVKKSRKNLEIY